MVRPFDAKLSLASMPVATPTVIELDAFAIANGRCAASTAAFVFNIPAPQVCVVQMHSSACVSPAGTWQTVVVVELLVANGDAESFNSAMYRGGVNCALTAWSNAAAPATSGAEKLVPTLMFAT